MQINLYTGRNFTAYGRKNIFIRERIEFHTDGDLCKTYYPSIFTYILLEE